MEYIATARNIKISPRKMRLVANGVKKHNLKTAMSALLVMNKRAAGPIKKALESAVANAANNFNANKDELRIKDIVIDEGVSLKRFHFAGRGRTRPYKRRSSHVRVILADSKVKQLAGVQAAMPAGKQEEKKSEEKSKKEGRTEK